LLFLQEIKFGKNNGWNVNERLTLFALVKCGLGLSTKERRGDEIPEERVGVRYVEVHCIVSSASLCHSPRISSSAASMSKSCGNPSFQIPHRSRGRRLRPVSF